MRILAQLKSRLVKGSAEATRLMWLLGSKEVSSGSLTQSLETELTEALSSDEPLVHKGIGRGDVGHLVEREGQGWKIRCGAFRLDKCRSKLFQLDNACPLIRRDQN